MNPLTKVKLINELNEREAQLGVKETVSWHTEYKDSAWIFVGGFPYELTEGDIICVFSQYGEIVNINLVRDQKTGKSKGFCFICYEDQRSTILAVDNLNGIKIKGRTIRVDHVSNYRPPKDTDDIDDITKNLRDEGCAPKLPDQLSSEEEEEEEEEEPEEQYVVPVKKSKKDKKEKKKKKKEKKEKKKAVKEERDAARASSSPPPALTLPPVVTIKQEKQDAGYDSYVQKRAPRDSRAAVAEQRDTRSGDRHGSDDDGFRGRHGDRRTGEPRHCKEEERRRESQWEREGGRQREKGRERDGERERERDGDGGRERERERDGEGKRTREREDERNGESDRKKERDVHRERERDRDADRRTDREKDRGSRRREHSRDREHRRP